MGNILAVNVHKANQHDTKDGIFVFEKALFLYPRIIAGCVDEGYRGTFKNTFEEFHNIKIDILKQIKPIFEVLPKRWRIERTFSWFGGYRRLSKDFEYLSLSEENIIYISHAHLLLSRL
jgi:putative transposase